MGSEKHRQKVPPWNRLKPKTEGPSMRASKANSYQLIMPNQFQCVRQTAAVLMACGLIASLLPGFAAAQDLSTQAARTARAGAIVPLDGPVLAGSP
jgi:hypothetical protein